MASFLASEGWTREGVRAWDGPHSGRLAALEQPQLNGSPIPLGHLLGSRTRIDGSPVISSKAVLAFAERSHFISTKGNVPGFVTALPKSKVVQRVVEAVNEKHYSLLNAAEIEFPTLFDISDSRLKDLTSSYESDHRMFAVRDDNPTIRLSYAADPGLFALFADCTFVDHELPYAVSTDINVLRRYKAGELGGFPTLREFPMPDVHIICAKDTAIEFFLKNLNYSATMMKLFFPGVWVFSCDLTAEIVGRYPDICQRMAQAVGEVCIFNVLRNRPRYYSIKTVFMMDAGDRSIMNFNMQWDEENPKRFNIRSSSGKEIVIIHGTLMHSWYKVLPVYINQHLAYSTPHILPVPFSPIQVAIIYLTGQEQHCAMEFSQVLKQQAIRNTIIPVKKSLSTTLARLKKNDIPYFSIIGPREAVSGDFHVRRTHTGERIALKELRSLASPLELDSPPLRVSNQRIELPFR
jgi:threonyl-tRNA synthetase